LDVVASEQQVCAFAGRLIGVSAGECARTVMSAYRRVGLNVLAELDGAYVVVISDGTRAWVARDRLGAWTVSYAADGRDVALGEHDADVLELLPASPAPDRLAVVQWIERGSLPVGRSFFSGIRHLRTGHLLELTARGVAERLYWEPTFRQVDRGTREEHAALLRDEVFAAVARAREGAMRPGICLSGGLDSAAVAAGLAATTGEPVQAVAITYPQDPEVDEAGLIERTAAVSRVPVTYVPVSEAELMAPALRYIRRWSVPPPTPMLGVWETFWRRARELGIDVILDGQGGDEAFGALATKFLISDSLRRGRLAHGWRLAGSLPGPSLSDTPSRRQQFDVMRRIGLSGALPASLQAARRRRLPNERLVSPLVCARDARELVEQDDQWSFKRRSGPMWWRATVALFMDGPDAIDANGLFRRDSQYTGIERREPFSHDVPLMERLLRIPPDTTFDRDRDRPLLRDALAGHIAEEIRTRHAKLVFNAFVTRRLFGPEGDAAAAPLLQPDAPVRAYVNGAALDRFLAAREGPVQDRYVLYSQIYSLWSIDSWLRAIETREGRGEEG
jgi:asparagine synthetase B (glutamine-hydrolysing)